MPVMAVGAWMSEQQAFKSTLAVLAALAIGYVLVMSLKTLVVLLIAIIIASAARPLVARLTRFRVPYGLAVLLIYAGMILSTFILLVAVAPPIFNQFADYLQNESRLANRIVITKYWVENSLSNLVGEDVRLIESDEVRRATSDVVDALREAAPQVATDLGSVLGEVVLVIVMGVYWLASRDKTIDFVTRIVHPRYRETAREALFEIEESMGGYTRGIVFVALFVGVAHLLLLSLFGIPNASTYAFIVGVTSILPIVGGPIGGGLATLLALLGDPVHGLVVFGVFIAVTQVEAHYLSPRLMSRSIGLDALLVLVAIFVGFALYGVIGAIISVPILGTMGVLLRKFVIEPRQERVSTYTVEEGIPIFRTSEATPAETPAVLTPEQHR